jgi:glycosyltransferase involved in cell wall biosynthesis
VPAKTIKDIVIKYYPQVSTKILVTPEGLGDKYAQTAREIIKTGVMPKLKKTDLKLVYTGSLYPHKNLALVLKALKNQPQWQLTIVGVRSIFQKEIKHQIQNLEIQSQVNLIGYLTDRELISLYQQSHALVQPSLSEGFGLTGIEAMAAGTLVIASDIPIFHEVYKSQAIFFNPKSISHFEIVAEYVANLDQRRRQKRLEQSLNLSLTYKWSEMVKITLGQFLAMAQDRYQL